MICLEHCSAYLTMSLHDRASCVESPNLCPIYLIGTHSLSKCNKAHDQNSICRVENCTKHHHKTLHGATSPFLASVMSTDCANSLNNSAGVLLATQSIRTKNGLLHCLFDNAATCSLITRAAAQRLKLKGKGIKLTINTVTRSKPIDSNVFYIPLID